MPAVILDACGTINLYATGRFVSLLTALGHDWYLPAAAMRETKYIRQPDKDDPGKLVPVTIDLQPALDAGVLRPCDCRDEAELALYVELATRIRDDGEAMGLAIAACRGWQILTDDRKARRIGAELNVPLVSTPEVMKAWAEATSLASEDVAQILRLIQLCARFTPNSSLPECAWWLDAVGKHPK
jgi:hypothetical protein